MPQLLHCPNCGVQLTREAVQGGWVHCEYCGSDFQVGKEAPQAPPPAEIPSPAAQQVVFGSTWEASEVDQDEERAFSPPAPQPTQSKSRGCMAIPAAAGTAIMSLAGIGIAIYFVFIRNLSGDDPFDTSKKDLIQEERVLMVRGTPVCPVDGNGDGVKDVAVLMKILVGGEETNRQIRTIDGQTGEVLKSGPLIAAEAELVMVCLGDGFVGYQLPDFEFHVFGATDLAPGPVLALRDTLTKVATGEDCVRLATSDGTSVGIAPSTGKESDCDAKGFERINARLGMPTFKDVRTFEDEKSVFKVKARSKGTPMLEVSCQQGKKTLWEKDLDVKATSFGIPAVLTGSTLAVIGAEHPKDDIAHLVGLDRGTGEERFDVQLQGSSTATFGASFWDNGKLLVVSGTDGTFAYDPITGDKVWTIQ